jgi:hypothetical protein
MLGENPSPSSVSRSRDGFFPFLALDVLPVVALEDEQLFAFEDCFLVVTGHRSPGRWELVCWVTIRTAKPAPSSAKVLGRQLVDLLIETELPAGDVEERLDLFGEDALAAAADAPLRVVELSAAEIADAVETLSLRSGNSPSSHFSNSGATAHGNRSTTKPAQLRPRRAPLSGSPASRDR